MFWLRNKKTKKKLRTLNQMPEMFLFFFQMSKPKDLNFSDIVVDIGFHPQKDVIAAGTIEGQVILYVHFLLRSSRPVNIVNLECTL